MHPRASVSFVMAALVFFCCTALLPAQDEQPAPAAPTAEELTELIKQLGSQEFPIRKAATEKLIQAGTPAIAPVAAAAEAEDLETAVRSIAILDELKKSPVSETAAAAKAALEKLAQSEKRSVARRAQAAIAPPEAAAPQGGVRGGIIIGNVQIAQGNVRNVRMRAKVENGRKEVDVDENGKQIKITEDPEKGIVVTTTEPAKDGKGEKKETKIEAKNAEELKKNNPEAYKLYEKYAAAKNAGAIEIQVEAIAGPPIPIQVLPAQALPVRPALPFQRAALPRRRIVDGATIEGLKAAQERIGKATEELRKLAGDGDKPVEQEAFRKLLDELEAANKQLTEAQEKLAP